MMSLVFAMCRHPSRKTWRTSSWQPLIMPFSAGLQKVSLSVEPVVAHSISTGRHSISVG